MNAPKRTVWNPEIDRRAGVARVRLQDSEELALTDAEGVEEVLPYTWHTGTRDQGGA